MDKKNEKSYPGRHIRVTPREIIPVRKVPASSVRYGESVSRNGKHVWVATDGTVTAVGATAGEARLKFKAIREAQRTERAAQSREAQWKAGREGGSNVQGKPL